MISIAILRAAGLTEAQIMRVLEIEQQEHKLTRREQNRINKQNQRSRHQSQHVSADTHVIDDPPHAYTTPPIEKPKKVSLSRGTRIADDWIASAEDVAFARQHLPDDNAIAEEEAKFRDYWKARPGAGGRKVDWPATWRNWIRNNRRPNGHGNGGAPRPGSREDRQERSANAYRKLSEYVEAHSDETQRGDGARKETAPWLSLVKPT